MRDMVVTILGSAGYMVTEEYRAELRRQRRKRRELDKPFPGETRAYLTREAVESIARMLGEDQGAAAARIGEAAGIAPRRILRWCEHGPDDLEAWNRFQDAMPAVEQGVLARNLRAFLERTNGELQACLAGRLAQLREQRGWSEERLASRLHVPAERVRGWESGRCRPTVAELAMLHYRFALVPEAIRPYERGGPAEGADNAGEAGCGGDIL